MTVRHPQRFIHRRLLAIHSSSFKFASRDLMLEDYRHLALSTQPIVRPPRPLLSKTPSVSTFVLDVSPEDSNHRRSTSGFVPLIHLPCIVRLVRNTSLGPVTGLSVLMNGRIDLKNGIGLDPWRDANKQYLCTRHRLGTHQLSSDTQYFCYILCGKHKIDWNNR